MHVLFRLSALIAAIDVDITHQLDEDCAYSVQGRWPETDCCCQRRWQGTAIEIFETVTLPEPYTIDVCAFKDGCDSNATVMERVRAVLEAELQRLDAPAATA